MLNNIYCKLNFKLKFDMNIKKSESSNKIVYIMKYKLIYQKILMIHKDYTIIW